MKNYCDGCGIVCPDHTCPICGADICDECLSHENSEVCRICEEEIIASVGDQTWTDMRHRERNYVIKMAIGEAKEE